MDNNNFTLDELHQLLNWALKHQQCCGKSEDPTLMIKLEVMINNYCDHEIDPLPNLDIDECIKCGKLL